MIRLKTIYIHKIYLRLKIKGKWETIEDIGSKGGRYIYFYGDVPSDETERFRDKNTVFSDLITKMVCYDGRYGDTFKGNRTFLRKRLYISIPPVWGAWENEIIYKDKLEAFDIEHIYEVIKNPNIEDLKEDLGFFGYSQLVFDREKDLKSMLHD